MNRLFFLILALFATSALAVDIPVRNPSSGGALTVDPKVNVAGTCGNGNVCSGTYTPTVGTKVNVDATTIYAAGWSWMRVGNVLTVAGIVSVDATVSGNTYTHLFLSLPFTRPSGNFTSTYQCSGTGGTNTSLTTGNYTWAVVSNNAAQTVDLLTPGVVTTSFQDVQVIFQCQL